jgi:peptide/nickel transport system permease protein
VPDPETRRHVQFLVEGPRVHLLGVIPVVRRLFGLSDGQLHRRGTDSLSRDVFSRTLFATRTSLSIGVLGALISFLLVLSIGGAVDYAIQRLTKIIRVIPVLSLYMALAAAMPREWSTTQVCFAMTLILGALGWPTLARRIRSQLLSIRREDYVTAAADHRAAHAAQLHHRRSGDLLSLHDPGGDDAERRRAGAAPAGGQLGGMLFDAQSIRAIEQAPWLFIPAAIVVVAVRASTVIGEGLREGRPLFRSAPRKGWAWIRSSMSRS